MDDSLSNYEWTIANKLGFNYEDYPSFEKVITIKKAVAAAEAEEEAGAAASGDGSQVMYIPDRVMKPLTKEEEEKIIKEIEARAKEEAASAGAKEEAASYAAEPEPEPATVAAEAQIKSNIKQCVDMGLDGKKAEMWLRQGADLGTTINMVLADQLPPSEQQKVLDKESAISRVDEMFAFGTPTQRLIQIINYMKTEYKNMVERKLDTTLTPTTISYKDLKKEYKLISLFLHPDKLDTSTSGLSQPERDKLERIYQTMNELVSVIDQQTAHKGGGKATHSKKGRKSTKNKSRKRKPSKRRKHSKRRKKSKRKKTKRRRN